MGGRHFVERHKRLSHHHIRQVPPLAACFVVIHQVVVASGDVEADTEGAVHSHGAVVPVVQGIGIGVYGHLESYEGREHLLLEVCLAVYFHFIATILSIDCSAAMRVVSSIDISGLSFSRQVRMFSSVTNFI